MTFDATVTPVVYEGGMPVFIDTEYDVSVSKTQREFYRAIASIVMIDVIALLSFIISIKINWFENVHFQSRANRFLIEGCYCTINILNIPCLYFIHNSKISYIFINKMIDLQ